MKPKRITDKEQRVAVNIVNALVGELIVIHTENRQKEQIEKDLSDIIDYIADMYKLSNDYYVEGMYSTCEDYQKDLEDNLLFLEKNNE